MPARRRCVALLDGRLRDFLPDGHAAEGVCWSVPDQTRNWVLRSVSADLRAGAASTRRQRNLRTSSLRVFSWLNRSMSSSSMRPPNEQHDDDQSVCVRKNITVLRVKSTVRAELYISIQNRTRA